MSGTWRVPILLAILAATLPWSSLRAASDESDGEFDVRVTPWGVVRRWRMGTIRRADEIWRERRERWESGDGSRRKGLSTTGGKTTGPSAPSSGPSAEPKAGALRSPSPSPSSSVSPGRPPAASASAPGAESERTSGEEEREEGQEQEGEAAERLPLPSEEAGRVDYLRLMHANLRILIQDSLGAPYASEGEGDDPRTGFKPAGYVRWLLRQVGYSVEGQEEDMILRAGVAADPRRPVTGDLLFFRVRSTETGGARLFVAVYEGNGRMAYPSFTARKVIRGDLRQPFWQNRLVAVRRVVAPYRF